MRFPWRYVVPRTDYFKALKIAKHCPEIAPHMDKVALYVAGGALAFVPIAVLFVIVFPFVAIGWAAKKVLGRLPNIPDFSELRYDTITEAHRIVPVDEIRRRIGLEPLPTVSFRTAPHPEPKADDENVIFTAQ